MRFQLTAVGHGLVLRLVKVDSRHGLIDVVEHWPDDNRDWAAAAARHAERYGDACLQHWLVAAARSLLPSGPVERPVISGPAVLADTLLSCVAGVDAATDPLEVMLSFHQARIALNAKAAFYVDHGADARFSSMTRSIVDDVDDLLAPLRSTSLVTSPLWANWQVAPPWSRDAATGDAAVPSGWPATFVVPVRSSAPPLRFGVLIFRFSKDGQEFESMARTHLVWVRDLARAVHGWSERTPATDAEAGGGPR